MNDLMNGAAAATMTSREIADLVELRHDNVKRTIETLIERNVIASPQIEEKPTGGRPVIEYLIGKRDSFVIVAQLSPEFTARLVDRWQQLEAQAGAFSIPQTLPEALRLAADLADRNKALELKAQQDAPKVEALDRISTADGTLAVTNAAKSLQVRPKDLFDLLSANHWIYRRPGGSGWLAYQDKLQSGVLTHKITTVQREDGTEKICEQVRVTGPGLTRLAQMISH